MSFCCSYITFIFHLFFLFFRSFEYFFLSITWSLYKKRCRERTVLKNNHATWNWVILKMSPLYSALSPSLPSSVCTPHTSINYIFLCPRRFLFLIQILCAYIFCGPAEECAESRPIWSRTPFAGARRPPFLAVSLINPEWLAWKPLVFVLERARTVNFVGSGLLRNMADLGTRVVLRSSCLSPLPPPPQIVRLAFLSSFASFARREWSPRDSARVSTHVSSTEIFHFRPSFFFFIAAVRRLKCKLFLCPRALHKV